MADVIFFDGKDLDFGTIVSSSPDSSIVAVQSSTTGDTTVVWIDDIVKSGDE